MMGLDQVAAMLLTKAVEAGVQWARISDVRESGDFLVITATFYDTKTEEDFIVDVNTVKNGVLRILTEDGMVTPPELKDTMGLLTKYANDPGELIGVEWNAGHADAAIQAGLFSELVYAA